MHLKFSILFAVLGFAVIFILLPDRTGDFEERILEGGIIAHLPNPSTNNAVAYAMKEGDRHLFSFSGLGSGKTHEDIHSNAYDINIPEQFSTMLDPVPGQKDRLASIAVTVGNTIYVIGGYTVAEDESEKSTPEVFAYDPEAETYTEMTPMPVPVDDTVAFVYEERFIYLVSGWHDTGNVSNVQVYDTRDDRWFSATEFPGSPVFGHAGGIVGNRFVIADGVAVFGEEAGQRQFGATDEAYLGIINPDSPNEIDWRRLPPHPGNPLYCMAATGDPVRNMIIFAGGSDNPYNYIGIGYNGEPSEPSAAVFGFDLAAGEWRLLGKKPFPSMDHRGLLKVGSRYYIVGGMIENQIVSDAVSWFSLPEEDE